MDVPDRYQYLSSIVVLALAGHGILWARYGAFLWSKRRIVLRITFWGGLWMILAEFVGLHWGIWTISQHRTLAVLVGGVFPVEDFLAAAIGASGVACGMLVFGYRRER